MTVSAVAPAPEPPVAKRPRRGPSVGTIVAEVWGARDLVSQFVKRDLTIRYTQAVMGVAWAVLMPLLIVGAGVMFRVVLATLSNTHVEGASIASIAVKALPWAFFAGALSMATQSIIGNANLIGKVYFPREALPLSTVIAQCPDLVVGLAVVTVILPFVGVPLAWSFLWVPPLLLLLAAFTVGISLLLSCANLFFRDVKYIVQVLLTFGIFFTPVLFEPVMVGPTAASIIMLNPVAPVLEGLRLCIVEHHNLLQPLVATSHKGITFTVWHPWYLAYTAAWAIGGLLGSALLFHRLEFVFAEYI